MAYITSNSITIFPSAKRGVDYPYARLTVEATFPNIINKLLDANGFVITDTISNNLPFEFNIYGYYVKLDRFDTLTNALIPAGQEPETGTVIYAQITIDSAKEISGQDAEGKYKGVVFNTTNTLDLSSLETSSVHNQVLCQWNGSAWIIPSVAKLIFNKNSVANLDIDGGVI